MDESGWAAAEHVEEVKRVVQCPALDDRSLKANLCGKRRSRRRGILLLGHYLIDNSLAAVTGGISRNGSVQL